MRVVFLTHNYPRAAGDVPGNFLHPLAVALREKGIDVRVVAPSDRGAGGPAELDGVPINRVRYGTPDTETLAYTGAMAQAIRSPQGLRALARLNRALRAGTIAALEGASHALVHAHWWFPAGVAAPRGPGLLITCHGTDVQLLTRSVPIRWLGRRTLRRAAKVTTVSRALAGLLSRFGGISVGADAVQPMPVQPVARPWSTGGGGVIVLGRLTAQKRVDLALHGYAQARRQGLDLRLTIVGDGPARPALEALAAELHLGGHAGFVGAVAPSAVPTFLATADLALMPAADEGLGLAAAEALMQGVPVVACRDGGGLLDIVPAEGAGRLADPEPAAVAAALLSLRADPGAPPAARAAGVEWRERLSPGYVADRCLAWYTEILDA